MVEFELMKIELQEREKAFSEFTELLDLRLELKDLENKLRRLKIGHLQFFYSLEGLLKIKYFLDKTIQMILKRFLIALSKKIFYINNKEITYASSQKI
jgi:hypothetical protein